MTSRILFFFFSFHSNSTFKEEEGKKRISKETTIEAQHLNKKVAAMGEEEEEVQISADDVEKEKRIRCCCCCCFECVQSITICGAVAVVYFISFYLWSRSTMPPPAPLCAEKEFKKKNKAKTCAPSPFSLDVLSGKRGVVDISHTRGCNATQHKRK